MNKEYSFVI